MLLLDLFSIDLLKNVEKTIECIIWNIKKCYKRLFAEWAGSQSDFLALTSEKRALTSEKMVFTSKKIGLTSEKDATEKKSKLSLEIEHRSRNPI